MIDWALRYIKLGWAVIPLRGKIPLVEHGSRDATLNESQAREWWTKWPEANIGVASGHRFFAVDIDIKKGGEETWEHLRATHGFSLPATIEQITGTGGRHILFALPEFPVQNSAEKLGPGLDVRGSGGYIVVAPSVHPDTKKRYEWDGLEEIEKQAIAPAPEWLLKLLRDAQSRPAAGGGVKALPDKIRHGTRDDTIFREGCRLRRYGWTVDEIFASLKIVNASRCEPPLDDAQVRKCAESAAKYEPDRKAVLRDQGSAAGDQAQDEVALGQSDVEKGIEEAIAANDLKRAVEWAPEVAKLRPDVQALISMKLAVHFGDKFPRREFQKVLAGAKVIKMPPPSSPPGAAAGTDGGDDLDLLSQPLTDSGNGERLVAMFGRDLRFCKEMKKWLVWDGRRWVIDDWRAVHLKAKRMARELYARAVGYPDKSKWARSSESRAAIVAMLECASGETGIPVSANELDQHPYLLNCLNGVVDLRTGELLPHERELLITKMCHIVYEADAKCPRFLKFLHWAMGQNEEAELSARTARLMSYMQRSFGYALTGDVTEKCAFVFWGEKGNNGKTTLLDTMRLMFPEYSAQITIDVLMTNSGMSDSTMRADLADLRGVRLAVTSEVEKEHKLSVAIMKRITSGGGRIKSCRKYENPIEFPESHKLFMDCNHRPRVTDQNNAIWRRLKLVAFDVSMEDSDPAMDKKLKEKLLAEASGILAWCVRGSMRWAKEGLEPPPEVAQAVEEWREHDDPLKEFMEDCCEPGADRWVRSSLMYSAYVWFAKKARQRFWLGVQEFTERMRTKGFEFSRSRRDASDKQLRTWEGIGLRDGVEAEMAASEKAPSWSRQASLED